MIKKKPSLLSCWLVLTCSLYEMCKNGKLSKLNQIKKPTQSNPFMSFILLLCHMLSEDNTFETFLLISY